MRNALEVEAKLAGLREKIRQLQAEVARVRSEGERVVSLAVEGRETAEQRTSHLRKVVNGLLRAWGVTPPEDIYGLEEVLPLPPRGVDRGTMTSKKVVKVRGEAAPAVRPRVSTASVQTDAVRVEGVAEEGGSLLRRMEEILETRLASFWERVSWCFPGSQRSRAAWGRGSDSSLHCTPSWFGNTLRCFPNGRAEAEWREARGWRSRRAPPAGSVGPGQTLEGGSPVLGGRVWAGSRGKGGGVTAAPAPKPSLRKIGVSGMGRIPSRAAVALHIPGASPATYAEILREAVKITPEDRIVSGVCPRPSASGGVILEVPGGGRGR